MQTNHLRAKSRTAQLDTSFLSFIREGIRSFYTVKSRNGLVQMNKGSCYDCRALDATWRESYNRDCQECTLQHRD